MIVRKFDGMCKPLFNQACITPPTLKACLAFSMIFDFFTEAPNIAGGCQNPKLLICKKFCLCFNMYFVWIGLELPFHILGLFQKVNVKLQ